MMGLPMNENELKKPWLSSTEDDDVFSDILESRHLVVFPWLTELPDVPGSNPRGAPWLCFEFGKA
jgi:hypothetical protein